MAFDPIRIDTFVRFNGAHAVIAGNGSIIVKVLP